MFKRKIEDIIKNLLFEDYRKPILIQGVRQCGKTTVMKEIVKDQKHIYINLEKNLQLTDVIKDINLSPNEIVNTISLFFNEQITEDTILVFDEIQILPQLITAMKYFYEDSKYRVIASGSNLGATIFRENYSFPVGKVNLIHMYPLDFDEFLWATNNEMIQRQLEEGLVKGEINKMLHIKLTQEFRNYLIVGGLPEVVNEYIQKGNYENIQEILITSYENDFTKYANSKLSIELLTLWRSIGQMLAKDNQKFQANLLKKGSTINDWNEKVFWLEKNGLINKVDAIKSTNIPIFSNKEMNHYKVFYFDVGLLTKIFNYKRIAKYEENDRIFLGIISENYVANSLNKLNYDLYYYHRRTSEIDFMIEKDNKIIPIEVKSAYNTKAKSLDLLMKNNELDIAIISSLKEFNLNETKKSIPLYAIHKIDLILNRLYN